MPIFSVRIWAGEENHLYAVLATNLLLLRYSVELSDLPLGTVSEKRPVYSVNDRDAQAWLPIAICLS